MSVEVGSVREIELGASYSPSAAIIDAAAEMSCWSRDRLEEHWRLAAERPHQDTSEIVALVEQRMAAGQSLADACFGFPTHPRQVNQWAWIRNLVNSKSDRQAGGEGEPNV